MYRFVAPESMTVRTKAAVFTRGLFLFTSCLTSRRGVGLLLMCALLGLAGCSAKTITSKDPFVVQQGGRTGSGYPGELPSGEGSGQRTGTVYLPSDDGVQLSRAELEAFLSEGELDRNLSKEDLQDVLLHFKYLVHKDRYTVEKNMQRAEMYMPYIFDTLKAKGLPRELAYVAFIESGYNPKATSRTGAAGMWQFISSTGKHYGMTQDWWLDERRDPYQSTKAAADYLSKLYGMFNDWHLAVTAYNAGEGKIQRGMAASGAKTFFELRRRNDRIYSERDRLSDENKQYLPKFLAVCKIVRNLEKLGFSRVDFSGGPRVAELRAKPGTDLMQFTKNMGLDWEEFAAHNPACQRYVSHPNRLIKVYVPQRMATKAQATLASMPTVRADTMQAGFREYKVGRGDTMASISRKTGVPVAELRQMNQVSEPLRAGKVLRIPGTNRSSSVPSSMASLDAAPRIADTRTTERQKNQPDRAVVDRARAAASEGQGLFHEVKTGDTMYSLAKRYSTTQEAILAANNMSNHDLSLGQQLRIPTKGGRPVQAESPRTSVAVREDVRTASAKNVSNRIVQYQVQSGDTLWAIARKFNIAPGDLLNLNNMNKNTALRPGDTVRVAVN